MNDPDHAGHPRLAEPDDPTRLADVASTDIHNPSGPTRRRSATTVSTAAGRSRGTGAVTDVETSPGPVRGALDSPDGTHHVGNSQPPSAPAAAEPPPSLFTPAQAAQLLQVRESWLRRRAAQRRIPCTFLGKHLRFSPADLDQIITDAARPATDRQQAQQPGTGNQLPRRTTVRPDAAQRRRAR
jgi:excisionase family DNA binding protein